MEEQRSRYRESSRMQGKTRAGGENCTIGIVDDSDISSVKKETMRSSGWVDRFSPRSDQSVRADCCGGSLEEIGIDWGGVVSGTDFASQVLRIGNLYYSAIDLGESITVSTQLQQALGLPGLFEFNQCVLLHLAASYVWTEQGRINRAPHRGPIDSLAAHLRSVEFQQASQ